MLDDISPAMWVTAGVVACVLVVTVALIVDRRSRRRHKRFVREAMTAMAEAYEAGPVRAQELHRELVGMLADQDATAAGLEQDARPVAPAGDGPVDEAVRAMLAQAVTAAQERLAGANPITVVTAELGAYRRGFSEMDPSSHLDDTARPIRRVPVVADVDGVDDLCERMRTTLRTHIRVVQHLLAEARRLGEDFGTANTDLTEALEQAVCAATEGANLAGAGDPVLAMRSLVHARLPISADGVPGAGVERDLKQQAFALADLALVHRDALGLWCRDVTARCGHAPGLPDGVSA